MATRTGRVVTGSFRALEEAFLAAVTAARTGGTRLRPVWVLVPSNLLRIHLQARLAEGGGAANVRFHLFPDLARALTPGGRDLPPLLADLLLEELLAERESLTGPLGPIATRPGLREALLDAFAELGGAAIGPQEFAAAVARAGGAPGTRLGEVARLYAGLRRAVTALGLLDPSERLLEAAREAASSPEAAGTEAVLVYGFHRWSEAERRLLLALAGIVPLTAFVPWRDAPAFEPVRPVLAWLEREGFARSAAPEPAGGRPARLAALSARLFRPPAGEAVADDGSLLLLSCPGEAREADAVARLLARRARRGDLAFERSAVLVRRLRGVREPLSAALARHGVPAAVRRPLGESGAARVLDALFAAHRSSLGRAEVVELFDLEVAALPAGERPRVDLWDRLSREAGIVRGAGEWQRRLEALAAAVAGERAAEAARALATKVAALAADLAGLPERALPGEHARAWCERVERRAPAGEERARLLATLAGLEALDAARRPIGFERFADLAARALDAASLPLRRLADGRELRPLVRGALVADISAARGVPFDLVVLPGLVERSFPAPPREDPILLDAERIAIGDAVGRPGSLATSGERLGEERLLFALGVESAGRALVLSWPRIDAAAGRERVPSSFLLAVAEALRGERADYGTIERLDALERVPLSALPPAGFDPQEAQTEIEYDLATAAAPDPKEALHLAKLSPSFARGLALDHGRWSDELTGWDGVVPGRELPGRAFSASRLEAWAKCPIAYFFRHELRLEPLEEPADVLELDRLTRGSLVHAILFEFLGGLRAERRAAEAEAREELRSRLLAIAERRFAEIEATHPVGPAFAWQMQRRAMREDLEGWLDREIERERDFEPVFFELRFGPARDDGASEAEDPSSRDQPLEFQIEDGRVLRLRGRIDRVDVARDRSRFQVIDYKTGKAKGYRAERLAGGRALQLPVYLLAAGEVLATRVPPVKTGEASYWFVSREGGFREIGFGAENWPNTLQALRRAIALIVQGIESGVHHAEPGPDCRYCDFLRVCGSARERLAERKRADPRRAPFVALQEIS